MYGLVGEKLCNAILVSKLRRDLFLDPSPRFLVQRFELGFGEDKTANFACGIRDGRHYSMFAIQPGLRWRAGFAAMARARRISGRILRLPLGFPAPDICRLASRHGDAYIVLRILQQVSISVWTEKNWTNRKDLLFFG